MNSPKATIDKQQDEKKKETKKQNQRSGTELSQTIPRFSLLIVVVKDMFVQTVIIFLISHLALLKD